MITPELIGYIRGEFAKGKTREEIHTGLIADGGWNEADLSEAFRIVIPMQGFGESSFATKVKSSSSFWKILLILVVLGALGFAVWRFYRAPAISMWDSLVKNIPKLSIPYFNTKKPNTTVNTPPPNNPVVAQNNPVVPIKVGIPTEVRIKDCGIGIAPNLKNPRTYQNDAVLNCLGNSALYCEDAKAVLNDAFFPTIFQIIKDNNTSQSCNFKLSYGQDSTLVDATGKKLAGQYLTCPIGIVKSLDEAKQVPVFSVPDTSNLSKYASQIYFYGTLGLFIENNIEKNKIQALGCSGPYIDSVVTGYQKTQIKR